LRGFSFLAISNWQLALGPIPEWRRFAPWLIAKCRGSATKKFPISNPWPVCHNCETQTQAESAKNMTPRKKSAGKTRTDEIFIPDKLYFRIGEVASLCRLPAYVLRFWESEFPQLKPVKSNTGQRMYRRRDVESVLRIKQLLYEQGFTIVGARQQLRSETKTEKGQAAIPFPAQSSAEMQRIRQGLREILNLLSARRTG
jgi:DNA-binding transcriptional MerR regulator